MGNFCKVEESQKIKAGKRQTKFTNQKEKGNIPNLRKIEKVIMKEDEDTYPNKNPKPAKA